MKLAIVAAICIGMAAAAAPVWGAEANFERTLTVSGRAWS